MLGLPRRDSFSEYLASDTDLPYAAWVRERRALATARTQPIRKPAAPGGWSIAVLVLIVVASIAVTGVAMARGYLRGQAEAARRAQ